MIQPVTSLIYELMAILFVADSPVTISQLSDTLQIEESEVNEGLESLKSYLLENTPFQLKYIAEGYQISTRSEYSEVIQRFLAPQKKKLSRSLLEVLVLVAYHQPITQSDIELKRGVQSDYAMRQLLERGLVRDVGIKDAPGRPKLYGTTPEFLHAFNLGNLSELPAVGKEEMT